MKKLVGLLVIATALACGGATVSNDDGRSNHPLPDPTSSSSSSSSSSSGGSVDAGVIDPAPGVDAGPSASAFTGAAAFVATNGKETLKGQEDHPFPNGNPARQDCLTANCHGPGGEGPRFVVGGTVFKDVAGTLPAAQVEVRVLDAQGDAVITHSDVFGNFFILANQGANLGFPAKTGARDATTTRLMGGSVADGACNVAACHGGAATGPIHVP